MKVQGDDESAEPQAVFSVILLVTALVLFCSCQGLTLGLTDMPAVAWQWL